MRVASIGAKITFVTGWVVAGMILFTTLTAIGFSYFSASLAGYALSVTFMIVGVRTFRGRGEEIKPTRPLWRATATSAASLTIGSLLGLLAIGGSFATATTSRSVEAVTLGLILVLILVGFSIFYLHSGIRLRNRAPEPISANLEPKAARVRFR